MASRLADPTAYQRESNTIGNPALFAEVVSLSDTVDLTNPTRGLYVGGDGNVVCDMVGGGATVTFTGLLAGGVYPFQIKRVHATLTTATGLVGLR